VSSFCGEILTIHFTWAPTCWNGYLDGLTYNLADGGQLIADLPEPTSVALLLTGLAGGIIARRRKRA
jgi:hypothetical protein